MLSAKRNAYVKEEEEKKKNSLSLKLVQSTYPRKDSSIWESASLWDIKLPFNVTHRNSNIKHNLAKNLTVTSYIVYED